MTAPRFPPLCLPDEVFRGPVLALAPHCDDEVIAAGGTMVLLGRAGVPVHVVHVTDSAGGDPDGRFADVRTLRREEGVRALVLLGVAAPTELGFPDGGLAGELEEAVQALDRLLHELAPRHLLAPSPLEAHPDHQATAATVRELARRRPAAGVESVFFYGVNTPVAANLLIDITDACNAKNRAITQYASQLAYIDFRDKVRAADRARTVNVELPEVQACEAFARIEWGRLETFFQVAAAHTGVLFDP